MIYEKSYTPFYYGYLLGNDHPTLEKNHSVKLNAFKPLQIEVDPIVNLLCPQPQRVKQFKGLYFVPPKDLAVLVIGTKGKYAFYNLLDELF